MFNIKTCIDLKTYRLKTWYFQNNYVFMNVSQKKHKFHDVLWFDKAKNKQIAKNFEQCP